MSEAGKKRKINSDFVKDDSNLIKDAHDDAQQEKGGKGNSGENFYDELVKETKKKNKLFDDVSLTINTCGNFLDISTDYEKESVDETPSDKFSVITCVDTVFDNILSFLEFFDVLQLRLAMLSDQKEYDAALKILNEKKDYSFRLTFMEEKIFKNPQKFYLTANTLHTKIQYESIVIDGVQFDFVDKSSAKVPASVKDLEWNSFEMLDFDSFVDFNEVNQLKKLIIDHSFINLKKQFLTIESLEVKSVRMDFGRAIVKKIPAFFNQLRECKNLKSVYFEDCCLLTDVENFYFSLPSVKTLTLRKSRHSITSVWNIFSNLESIYLDDNSLTIHEQLTFEQVLAGLKNLKRLSIKRSNIYQIPASSSLTFLEVINVPLFTFRPSELPNLTVLINNEEKLLSFDQNFGKKLIHLSLGKVDNEQLIMIRDKIPEMESLSFIVSKFFDSLIFEKGFKKLKYLHVNNCYEARISSAMFKELNNLEVLILDGVRFKKFNIDHFSNMKKLREFHVEERGSEYIQHDVLNMFENLEIFGVINGHSRFYNANFKNVKKIYHDATFFSKERTKNILMHHIRFSFLFFYDYNNEYFSKMK